MFGIETYKRLLTGLTLSAALMLGASCAKIDNGERMEENIPVSFGTYGMRATGTKADPTLYVDGTNITNIPSGGEMTVFGWYSDNGNWTSSLFPNFMYNQQVQWTNGKTGYVYLKKGRVYFLEATGEIVFVSEEGYIKTR